MSPSDATGQVDVPTVPGQVKDLAGNAMPYQLIFPYNYDPQLEYPLVLFLHGSGESGTDNRGQINANMRGLIAATRSDEFASILVAPQTNIGWSSSTSDALVHMILDNVAGTYGVDPTRRYITGLSMGGFGTWFMAAEDPHYFAAAVPIAGGIDPVRAADLLNTPIWAFHGDGDTVVDVSWSRNIVQAMRDLGGQPRYTEYPGVPHDSWTRTYADPDGEMYGWMFAPILGCSRTVLVGSRMARMDPVGQSPSRPPPAPRRLRNNVNS